MLPGASGEDWHIEDVKSAIRKTGVTLSALSVRNGYDTSTIRKALSRKSSAAQQLIADHLGISPQKIWPSRYDENGRPIDLRATGKRKNSRRFAAAHRQKEEVV